MKIKQSDRVGYGVAEKFPLSSCVPFVASVLFASGASAGQGDCSNLTALQIPDTTITSAEYVAAANGLPGYCDLLATVAPQTDVEVRLPDDWSGRYLHFGGGGFDGRIPN
ncbi:MAG: tannase/feruloyl esterase family alpha/beta hydrolase, partial [Betaproteobacteria bacterium]